MFYHDPMMDTKCTYQNSELTHIRVDVAKVDYWISHVELRATFVKRTRERTYKTKDSNAQISM